MQCPECGKRGLKGRQGVSMHIGRVHSKTILPPYTQDAVAAGGKRYRKRRVQVEDHADHAEPTGSVAVLTRTTTRRAEETVTEQAIVPVRQFALNGCPNCFFPIGLMHEDLAARKIACPPYCPNCTCPVVPVRTALNLVARQPSLAHA
jgi:hypothetical protein